MKVSAEILIRVRKALETAYGLALDGQGNLYVTDYVTGAEGRLQAFRILTLPEPEATPAL